MSTTDQIASTLTVKQVQGLASLSATKFLEAATLGIAPNTLASLVRLGLADVKSYREQSSNPRARVENEKITRYYRITGTGCIVLRKARKG